MYWKMEKLVVILKNASTILGFLRREVRVRKIYLFMYMYIYFL